MRGSSSIMIIKSSEKQPLTIGNRTFNLNPVKSNIKIDGSRSRSRSLLSWH